MSTNIFSSSLFGNPWFIILLIWSLVWKLIALWKAAKHNHLTMFIILGVINTASILDIGYIIYIWNKDKKKQS